MSFLVFNLCMLAIAVVTYVLFLIVDSKTNPGGNEGLLGPLVSCFMIWSATLVIGNIVCLVMVFI